MIAPKIEIERLNENQFRARVSEGGSETSHIVTVKAEDHLRLTNGKVDAAELVRRSFEFLLENEPKESILRQFDLSVIGKYFPDYEREIRRRI